MAFITHTIHGVTFLTSTLLEGVPHGFSTRRGGVSRPPWDSLNLGPSRGDDPDAVKENYRRFCGAVAEAHGKPAAIDPEKAVLAKQVHETNVRPVTEDDAGKGLVRERDYTADALITDAASIPLVVFSADCGVLLLHDPVSGSVGAVHAGWRGCAGGIVEKAVREMERRYGADAANLRAAVGPCIGPCCFETDADVPDAMRAALGADAEPYLVRRDAATNFIRRDEANPFQRDAAADSPGGKWHVDLAGLNRLWLLRSGVQPDHIDLCGVCTACHPADYWSHRKMGEARGVQTALIMREAAE